MSEPTSWEAIGVSTLAGASTILGGMSLFFVRRFKPVPFSICLALAGGVMTYVTMVEMIPETIHLCGVGLIASQKDKADPRSESLSESLGWLLGTCCVFLGWLLAWAISMALDTCLEKLNMVGDIKFDDNGDLMTKEGKLAMKQEKEKTLAEREAESDSSLLDEQGLALKCAKESGLDLIDAQTLAPFYVDGIWDGRKALAFVIENEGPFTRFLFKMKKEVDEAEFCQIKVAHASFKRDQSKFLRLGVFTALALGIHNVPEGMATYTSYMEDKNFGYGMAFAIAVHNIPEGIAVAVPCYFGTGSWIKALSLCAISAVAEPLGACLAMAIKSTSDSELTDGIMFGFISGFMLRVAISELFFTAFRYDPTNVVANKGMCAGMMIMAFSLVLFEFIAV